MDAKSSTTQNRDRFRFLTALSSALSEWILIILLLMDAFFLYLATKICRSCKLQTPCLLCTRSGYLLGNEKLGLYRDLVCDAHKLEISSLAFCHVHQKLANAREMCGTCLLSFAKKISSLETCKLFLSKLGMDLDDGDQIFNTSSDEMVKLPFLRKSCEVVSPQGRVCSCCSQPSRNKPYPFKLFQNKAIFKELEYPDSPLSSIRLRARAYLPDGLSKAREILPMPLIANRPGDHSSDFLSNFRYRQLKITSESESEVPLSDDDYRSTKVRGRDVKKEYVVKSLKPPLSVSGAPDKLSVIPANTVLEKLNHPEPAISLDSSSVLKSQHHEDGSCDKIVTDSNTNPDHHCKEKLNPPISSEVVTKPVQIAISNDFSGVDVSRTSTTHVEKNEGSELTDVISKADKMMNDSDSNLASSAKGSQPVTFSESALVRESARLGDDRKPRLSQIPSPRWLQYPCTDPTQHSRKVEECKLFHSSSFHGLPSFNRRSNAELSCSESADGSIVSEIEGEVAVDQLLKRQIEMDQKSLSILYKELEEERNASAIAANQAMAMINKLQEEKAAMQLEVMQYLRMMEEQTEYEQEALQNLNDQLMEREKEVQDLEAELDSFRKPSRDESLAEKVLRQSFYSDGSESEYSTTSTPHVSRPTRIRKNHRAGVTFQNFSWPASGSAKENLLDFEDEKEYISDCLKSLEKNVRFFSHADASQHNEEDDEFNDERSENGAKGANFKQGLNEDEKTRPSFCSRKINGENCAASEMNSSEKHLSSNTQSLSIDTSFLSPNVEAESPKGEHENHKRLNCSCSNNKHSHAGKKNGIITLSAEVEHLNERLEALESDRDFLEHTINTLVTFEN